MHMQIFFSFAQNLQSYLLLMLRQLLQKPVGLTTSATAANKSRNETFIASVCFFVSTVGLNINVAREFGASKALRAIVGYCQCSTTHTVPLFRYSYWKLTVYVQQVLFKHTIFVCCLSLNHARIKINNLRQLRDLKKHTSSGLSKMR